MKCVKSAWKNIAEGARKLKIVNTSLFHAKTVDINAITNNLNATYL